MSMQMMHGGAATTPFRDRLKQPHSNSPGLSNSPAPYQHAAAPQNAYLPLRAAGKSTIPKPPKAPEKPLMPYMRYSRKIWDSVKAKNPDLRLWQIGKIIGQMWRELPETEKKEYNDAYEVEKVQYQENLKAYHNSSQYQNFLREKQRAEHMIEDEERRSKNSNMDQRVSIQPADYEPDNDGGMSMKHVAAARYHRNHALINEIFSDTVVPDGRAVVTEQRMTILKKQVKSLMEHQQKLERELNEINDKFEEKKRKFVESVEDFSKKYKQECDSKPVMTSNHFDELVIKHKVELRVKYDKMVEMQKQEQEKAAKDSKLDSDGFGSNEPQHISEHVGGTKARGTLEAIGDESQDSQASTIGDGSSGENKHDISGPPIDDEEDTLMSEPETDEEDTDDQ